MNGDDIAYASGTGWTFDGATVSLAGPGPFVLSTDDPSFYLATASNDTVTQTAVATLNSSVTAKFFKAEIGIFINYEPEDLWEELIDDPIDDPVDE